MNTVKWGFALLAVGGAILAVSGVAYAFHSGGVAECTGCHSMHEPGSASFLLMRSDPSSTCLNCHERAGDTGPSSYHISTATADMPAGTPPKQRTPGGDFGWLKKSYAVGAPEVLEGGWTHGHSIVAADKGYDADPVNMTAPGGTFPASQLGCTSCHNPHSPNRRLSTGIISMSGAPIIASGSYATNSASGYSDPPAAGTALGVYRLLGGVGYSKNGVMFLGNPAAKAPSTYNKSETTTQVRVAYGHATSGGHISWADWCKTCHNTLPATMHPGDQALGPAIATTYKTYVKSGDKTGDGINGFSSLVPFVEATANYATLAAHAKNDNSVLTGPSGSDRIGCLTCHRAHASGFMHALRFNPSGDYMVYDGVWPGIDNSGSAYARGRRSAETQAAYYDRPASQFAVQQRPLCNKCHGMD